MVVDRSLTSEATLDVLARLVRTRGVPRHIRSDNGPEFMAKAIREWLLRVGVATLYVEPGSPWENGYAESFPSRLRDELLEREAFGCLAEAKSHAERWRREYNRHRPHSSLGYLTPAEFAAGWAASAWGAASNSEFSSLAGFIQAKPQTDRSTRIPRRRRLERTSVASRSATR